MKNLFFLLLLFMYASNVVGQYAVFTQETSNDADLKVMINTSAANANITVMIGENLNNRDFSIGFTNKKEDADVIVAQQREGSNFSAVKSRLSDADVSVKYGERLINPSVRIELKDEGEVDFLVFYEGEEFDMEALIIALLPIINAQMGYVNEAIPYWGTGEGPPMEEQQEAVLTPQRYFGTHIARWISDLDDGYLILDDNSIFYVYDEDRYMYDLWKKHNDVVVTPTEVYGHYYISKNMGPYKDAETLRAICVKAK